MRLSEARQIVICEATVKVQQRGGAKEVGGLVIADIYKRVVTYCLRRLLPRSKGSNLQVAVKLRKQSRLTPGHALGGGTRYTILMTRPEEGWSSGWMWSELVALAHETTHVAQLSSGALKSARPSGWVWTDPKTGDKTKHPGRGYHGIHTPWEKEATKSGESLAYKFVKDNQDIQAVMSNELKRVSAFVSKYSGTPKVGGLGTDDYRRFEETHR